ncbi:MAG TPA: deoxyribonuclease IV [Thermomicrobiales bacterium]|nr:deoxyribonuclease IV [Thermomicrobiales bacterium]
MLRLGAHMSIAGGFDKAVERAKAVDSDALQIFTKNQNQWRARPIADDEVVRFKAALDEHQIGPVVAHDSYLINLASPKDDLWEKSIAAFREELERCELLGVPFLVTHPGSHTGSGTEAGIARVIDALDRIHSDMPGLTVVTLLETTAGQGSNLGSTFEELKAMLDGVKQPERVAVCLDTCHIFVAGYDIGSPEAYAETMDAFDRLLGIDKIEALHFNDAKQPLGSKKDRHHLIGHGHIGIAGFWNFMNDERLRGKPALLETEKGDDLAEDREAITILRAQIGAPCPPLAATTVG